MLDYAFLAFIAFFVLLGVYRPFLWVLFYVYIDILVPQKIGFGIIQSIPLSLIAFGAAFGGWLLLDRKQGITFTFRQALMILLLIYCGWTTQNADFPDNAVTKWEWVWKALLFGIFLPLTLTTRLRLEALGITIVLSLGAIAIATGMKTALGGGGYDIIKFFVNENFGLYESSTLATMAIAIIPLIVWFAFHGTIFKPDWRVKLFAAALIFSCLLIPIGTHARTGLVCIAVLALLILRDVKHRAAFIALGAACSVIALPFLPQSYYERMATITQPSGDQSASTRIAVWKWTLDYAQHNPTGGGFDAYMGNKITYEMPVTDVSNNTTQIEFEKVTDEARAYHSAIFEMLGEQGYPGLAIWLLLHGLGIWHMEHIRKRWRGRTGKGETWQAPLAQALQCAGIIYLVGASFQAVAFQPLMIILIAMQIGLRNHCLELEGQQSRERARLKMQERASQSDRRRLQQV